MDSHVLQGVVSLGSGAQGLGHNGKKAHDIPSPYSPPGTLHVRLLGCEQLLTTVPGRSPMAALASSPSESWLWARARQPRGGGGLTSELGRGGEWAEVGTSVPNLP